jgi:hypothetical protein
MFDAANKIKINKARTANAAADLAGEPTNLVPKLVPSPKGIKAKIAGAKKTLTPDAEAAPPKKPKLNIVDNILKKILPSRD